MNLQRSCLHIKGREGTNARCLRSGHIQTDTAKFPQIGRFHILGVEGYE
jgi:hypothetical protein